MEKELAELIVEIMEEFCPEEEARVYEGYSGRGMYGDKTHGVVVPEIGKLIAALIANANLLVTDDHDFTDPKFAPSNVKMDSLGRSIILY